MGKHPNILETTQLSMYSAWEVPFFFFFFLIFCFVLLLGSTPETYGGQIGAIAAGLHHAAVTRDP